MEKKGRWFSHLLKRGEHWVVVRGTCAPLSRPKLGTATKKVAVGINRTPLEVALDHIPAREVLRSSNEGGLSSGRKLCYS